MVWFLTALHIVAVAIVGFAVLRLVLRCSDGKPLAMELWLSLSFALGLGFNALAILGSIAVFGATQWWFVLGAAAAAAAASFLRGAPLETFGPSQLAEDLRAPMQRALVGVCAALIALLLAFLYENAASLPFTGYDGRATWNFKAKILLHEDTVRGEIFHDPHRVHYHREYPLLIPSALYALYELHGDVQERAARVFFSSIFLFQLLFLFGALRRSGAGPALAAMVTLFYAATPFRSDWSERDGGALNSGSVDIPLSFFALAACVLWLWWWRERARWQWLLAAAFGAFGLMTKNEGLIVLAATVVAMAAAAITQPRGERMRPLLLGLAGIAAAVALAAPSLWLARFQPLTYDEKYSLALINADMLRHAPERIRMIAHVIAWDIAKLDKWGFTWFVILGALPLMVWGWRGRRGDCFLDVLLFAWAGAYLFVYVVTPMNLNFHLNTSMSRLLSHFLPLVLFRIGLWIADRNPLRLEMPRAAEVTA